VHPILFRIFVATGLYIGLLGCECTDVLRCAIEVRSTAREKDRVCVCVFERERGQKEGRE
jgi:hypothetical protein